MRRSLGNSSSNIAQLTADEIMVLAFPRMRLETLNAAA
jgi:hypothetical protein